MTYRDYLATPAFRAVRRAALDRSGGTCEQCGKARATDPHHVRYVKWWAGEVDRPENIRVLCHACHCIAHGKES
jgi:hypothetical protein